MKRKLSLLLAMVLAMTMIMGISVTALAYAEGFPARVQCGQEGHPIASDDCHYYFVDTFEHPESGLTCLIGAAYENGDKAVEFLEENPYICCLLDEISGYDGPGWYSVDGTTGICTKCTSSGTTPDDPTPRGSFPAHTHNFKWQTITEPTKDADGLEGEVCSCGATRNTQKLSAYGYSLNQYATPMINAAKPGQTITFEFGEWNSFPKSFMAKLVDKSAQNITFVFHYKWNHVKQEITIPAGTPIDLNFDYYGPAKMAELYGAN